MATRAFCEHVGPELAVWSSRLHAISEKIESVPSIDKYKLLPQIEELHILITELDDRLHDLSTACSAVGEADQGSQAAPGFATDAPANHRPGVRFDYDFGG